MSHQPGMNLLAVLPMLAKRPSKLAQLWEKGGASYIHVVDMDGTTMGTPMNDRGKYSGDFIKSIHSDQVGGGVRSIKKISTII